MKHIRFITAFILASLCTVFSSCGKEEFGSSIDTSQWFCSYPVQVECNDSEVWEDRTASIILQFTKSGQECIVDTSIEGLYSNNRVCYDVKWYSGDTFCLCETRGGQTIQYYSGTIRGNQITFEFLSCDKVERTIVLSKLYF